MKSLTRTLLVVSIASALLLVSSASALASIPAGRTPYAVLANPAAHEVYVANMLGNTVTVIDSNLDEVTSTISMLNGSSIAAPVSLAHNPNTNKLYCVNFWSGRLAVISLPSKTVEAFVPVGGSHYSPRAVIVNPVGNLVYVSNLSQGVVYVVDGDPASPTYNTVLTQIRVGLYPRSLALNTSLLRLYVVNTSSSNVSVIDVDPLSINYNKVIATINTGMEPYAIALNHNTAKVYVASRRFSNVTVIDGLTNTVKKTVSVGSYPRALDVNLERNLIYTANQESNNVTVIDGASDTVTATVAAGTKPYAVASIGTAEGNTYVANYGTPPSNGTVTIIAPDFSKTETQAGVGPASLSIDNMFAKPKVYVGNYTSNDVTVIDPDFGSTSLVSTIDPFPRDIATSPTPLLTGSSASLARPFAGRIMKVWWRLDEEERWSDARITSGWGTESVLWEAQVETPLEPGPHTVEVLAMDMTGATVVSSDGFAAASPRVGSRASYSFTFGAALGSISGRVFHDSDGDGLFDTGEEGIAGAVVALRTAEGDVSVGRSVTTEEDGSFRAGDLETGTYSLAYAPPALSIGPSGEVLEPGWYVTLAPAAIELDAGEDVTGVDFGAARYGWIGGQVKDEYTSEPESGALVELDGTDRTALTDADGKYFFYELAANGTASAPFGSYSLSLRPPSGRLSHESLTKVAQVSEGAGATVGWSLYRQAWSSGLTPEGLGYWKNWRNHHAEQEMDAFLASSHSASGRFGDVTPASLADFLSFKGKIPMSRKAEAQLLVSWLNVVSGRLGVDVVLETGASPSSHALRLGEHVRVDVLLDKADDTLKQGSGAELEPLKDLLEQVNGRALF